MKKYFLVLLVAAVSVACSTGPGDAIAVQQLTPYVTKTVVTDTPVAEATAAIPPTLAVTPTAVVHIVSLGDTISSIALQYGVSIDAILLANPDISPNVMIVGDAVIIPAEGLPDSAKLDVSLNDAVQISSPYCTNLARGLWCSTLVENVSDQNIAFPVVTFEFVDEAGNVLLEKNTPTMLRKLDADNSIPAVLFLDEIPPQFNRVSASLFAAQGDQIEGGVDGMVEEESKVQINSLSATITGTMQVLTEGNAERQDLTIAAAALDADGNIVGVRRKDISVAVNDPFDFNITVFSTGNEIVDVILYTEVY